MRAQPIIRPKGSELVTVLIPARNEEETIQACVQAVTAQDYPALEILVVDGDSADRTRAIVQELAVQDPRLHVLDNRKQSIPAALNVGLAAAGGDWLVRIDAHSTITPGYVTRAVEILRSGPWGGVGGRKDAVGITPAGHAIAAALSSPFGVGGSLYHRATQPQKVDHVPFGAYPTEVLRALGGWDERLLANEDFELDYRLRKRGYELWLDPELTIAWQCRQSIPDLFRQYRRYGRGKALVTLKHPASLRPRHVAPPALVALTAAAPLLRRKHVIVALTGAYLTFVAMATLSVGRNLKEWEKRMWMPLVFPALHFGYGIGFWERLLSELRPGSRGQASAHP